MIDSDFALLDVKKGRHKLDKRLKKLVKRGVNGIPVTIKGRIHHAWSHDDGVSIEFAVTVEEVNETAD